MSDLIRIHDTATGHTWTERAVVANRRDLERFKILADRHAVDTSGRILPPEVERDKVIVEEPRTPETPADTEQVTNRNSARKAKTTEKE